MKVLLLSNLFPSPGDPTRGVFNLHRFGALARHCEARVIVPVPWWSRSRRPSDLLRTPVDHSFGLEASYPAYWSIPGQQALHGRGLYLSLRGQVRRLRRAFPFDAILAAWAYPDGVAAAHLARELGCPLVTMVLGSDINEFTRFPALCRQILWGLGEARRVIAVSGALQDRMVELGIPRDKVIVQHNGVDGEQFIIRSRDETRRQLGLEGEGPVICYAGNFKPEKGVEVLVEAMGKLHGSGRTDVRLALVGSGPLESQLRSRVEELGLGGVVKFLGRRPHPEMARWIAAGDAFCLPSYREGCPNVVLEALACGRPIVASHVGGVPELVSADTGVLVPPGDPERLAAGIQAVLSRSWDPERLRASVACLSWDQFGIRLRDVLASAVTSAQA